MSLELDSKKQLLNAYKSEFALSKKKVKPDNWYPKTAKEIEDLLNSFIKFSPSSKKFEKDLKDFLETSYAQVIENDLTLVAKNRNHEPWLTEQRKVWKNANSTNAQFAWYKSKFGYKLGNAFDDLDNSTDEILSLLEDPKRSGTWETKGMVVGDVQSGKTSHYTGLISKAVDWHIN